MKVHLLKVPDMPDRSFSYRQFKQCNINNQWHFHPEIELIHIHQGKGTQFMGDHIKRFQGGDMVLVGSNLPHFWRYDEELNENAIQETVYSTVIHFTEKLWGDSFLELPENMPLKSIFEEAKRGLLLTGQTRDKVTLLMEKIRHTEGTYRLIYLLECVVSIVQAPDNEKSTLASLGFQYTSSKSENDRINTIYEYSFQHFRERISLESIASKACLTPESFCRFFKAKAGKKFTQFIIELKVGYACKLLIENKLDNKQISIDSGFNNFTSFHKHFKAITGKTPIAYQKS